MALKKKLNKDEFNKLSEALKNEYIADGDGYRLDVDGDEDVGPLKRAKDREAQLRKDAEEKLRQAQEELEKINGDDARKKGDIATLEKSWQKKLEDEKNKYEAHTQKLTSHIKSQLVDNVAAQIASKISNAPNLLLPHLKARLAADFEGDSPVTRVLDASGKPTALTIDELASEFVSNKDFSAIMIASKASGGAGVKTEGAAGGAGRPDPKTDLSTLPPSKMVEYLNSIKTDK